MPSKLPEIVEKDHSKTDFGALIVDVVPLPLKHCGKWVTTRVTTMDPMTSGARTETEQVL